MKINWENTKAYYDELLLISDVNKRTARYIELIVEPWQQMMQMVQRGQTNQDGLAGARAWNWLLPEDFESKPSQMTLLEAANAWQVGEQALQTAVEAMHPFADKIEFNQVSGWLVLANPKTSDPSGRGYTGAVDFMQPRFVVQYDAPDASNVSKLAGAVAHEFNHLVRLRVFPWDMMNTSVADYIIHEGLAESFAAELFGKEIVGHYVTDISAADLAIAKQKISNGLDNKGFDVVRSYIFGDELAEKWGFDKIGMPTFGGYAIGYHIVQAYLKNTGKNAVEATFISAKEIIEQSGYL